MYVKVNQSLVMYQANCDGYIMTMGKILHFPKYCLAFN